MADQIYNVLKARHKSSTIDDPNVKEILESSPSLFWISKHTIDHWEVRAKGNVKLCYLYQQSNCNIDNCGMLHLCKDFLIHDKACTPHNCKNGFSHNMKDGHNKRVLLDTGIDNMNILRSSFPRLCKDFITVGKCNRFFCGYLHICPDYLLDKCIGKCKMELKSNHKKAYLHNFCNEHNKSVLLNFDFHYRPSDRQFLLANILIKQHHNSFSVSDGTSDTSSECSSKTTGCSSLSHVSNDKLAVLLCKYYLEGQCRKQNCPRLHICKDFLISYKKCNEGNCRYGFSHDPLDENNGKIMAKRHVDHLPNSKLIDLLRQSFPRICKFYQEDMGYCGKKNCNRIHICQDFTSGTCSEPNCSKSHDIKDIHNMNVLKLFSLDKIKGNQNISEDAFLWSNILISKQFEVQIVCNMIKQGNSGSLVEYNKLTFEKVFNYIVNEGSSCNLTDDSLLAFFDNDVTNAVAWFEESRGSFRIVKNHKSQQIVYLCPKNVRPCFSYWSKKFPCLSSECDMFHICKAYLMNPNHFTGKCKNSHNIFDQHNRRLVRNLKLTELSREQLESILKLRYPFVCTGYQAGICADGENLCPSLHVCFDFIKADCQSCDLAHESAFSSDQGQRLLKEFHIKERDFRSCVVLPKFDSAVKRSSLNDVVKSCVGTSQGKMRMTVYKYKGLKLKANDALNIRSLKPTGPTEEDVIFDMMNQGRTSFHLDSQICSHFDDVGKAEEWFLKHKDAFRLESAHNTKTFHICVEEIRPCPNYWCKMGNSGCIESYCDMFHVCHNFLFHETHNKRTCKFNHNMQDSHNRKVFSKLQFTRLSGDHIIELLKVRYPFVCMDYIDGACLLNDTTCTKLHICYDYLNGNCKKVESLCRYKHESGFNSQQALDMMNSYHIKPDDFKFCVIVPERKLDINKMIVVSNTGNFDPWKEEAICFKYVAGECEDATSCHLIHSPGKLPYLWQYKKANGDGWDNFLSELSVKMEEEFCDPSRDYWSSFLPVACTSFSMLSDINCNKYNEEYVEIRRLSTKSSVKGQKDDVGLTEWQWFWMKGDTNWVKYEKWTRSEEIELAFLNGELSFIFQTNEYNYKLSFDKMEQQNENPKYLTKRAIRRRPVYKTKDVKCLQTKSILQTPSHWPTNHFRGETIPLAFDKYMQLKTDFENSMDRKVLVLGIQEICNKEYYDSYGRKKMILQETLGDANEKFLYHGTDHTAVEAICVQNFDWRLYGTHAIAYGKGSYFSTTASYSHRYTTSDINGTRYMFVASILAGRFAVGNSTMKRPPEINTSTHDLYDSCVNKLHNPSIYVIFERDQCYPRYLIKYKERNNLF